MANAETVRSFVPAMGRDWLLPVYDPLTRVLGLSRVRRILLDQAALGSASRVLDVGCGTGSLAVLIKERHPELDVVALDPDPHALEKAMRKAGRAKASIAFDRGFADALPYRDASFDRVLSSFMLHHLEGDEKARTLGEVRRVLKPNGRFHLVDFAASPGAGPSGLHSHRRLRDSGEDHVLALMARAGFANSRVLETGSLLGGHLRIAYYQGSV